ncbi:ABC transporter substrate-binding protein [Planctomyces sp. SH-PL62]|uniref:ABC transporter substrate-binding protein n=1 Tax=Planctomyces sp. SH-PL62 TaxID=1636152 RepID=UPI0018D2DE1E|nr:helical backbone metal receptor [Planctomyces sp. SH-PL62]
MCVALVAATVGCRGATHEEKNTPTSGPVKAARLAGEAGGWPVEVIDSLGRRVAVAKPAERVVSLAPSNTEILFAVGGGDRVVGVTMMDDYPPEAKTRTSIGGMAPSSVNLEALAALKPDLVLATGGVQQPIVEPLERLGLTVVAIDAERPEDVSANIRVVGRLVGREAESEALATRFEERVDGVRRRVAARGSAPRPKVLYLLYDEPLMTVGPGTFLGRMIETAGGANVFGDVTARYPTPSDEEVLLRAPEVVLATFGLMGGGGGPEPGRQRLLKRPGWKDVPAVRDGRIVALDEDLTTRVGPRLVEGLEAVEAALAPPPG